MTPAKYILLFLVFLNSTKNFGQAALDSLFIIDEINQQVQSINKDTSLIKKTVDNSIRKKRGFKRRLVTIYADSLGILNAFYKDGELVKMRHSIGIVHSEFYFNSNKLIFVEKSCFEILPPSYLQGHQQPCSHRSEKYNLYFHNKALFKFKGESTEAKTNFYNYCGNCLNPKEQLSTTAVLQLMAKCKLRLKE